MSTLRIGLELALTKNAVIGKAHRLGLPPRKSPIKPSARGAAAAPASPKPAAVRLPVPHAPVEAAVDLAPATPSPVAASIAAPPLASVPIDAAPAASPARAARGACLSAYAHDDVAERGPAVCRYPIGDPGAPGFHYCAAPRSLNRSYCDEHHAIAWIPRRAPQITAPPLRQRHL